MIEFKNVTKKFDEKVVLNGVSFAIRKGEIVFIIGKSGTGKSVLLKNIVGLLRPDSGEVWVKGQRVDGLSEARYLPVRRHCGMVFQQPALLDSLSVYDNLAFGLRSHGIIESESEIEAVLIDTLKLVGLGRDLLWKYPQELSYGTQKRLSLARTLVLKPECLLFDEPTTSLDPVGTRVINELIRSLSHHLNATSIVVSHDMHCAIEIADRIFLLDQGAVVLEGTAGEFMESDLQLARDFMDDARRKLLDGISEGKTI